MFCPPRLPSRLPPTNARSARPQIAPSSPIVSPRMIAVATLPVTGGRSCRGVRVRLAKLAPPHKRQPRAIQQLAPLRRTAPDAAAPGSAAASDASPARGDRCRWRCFLPALACCRRPRRGHRWQSLADVRIASRPGIAAFDVDAVVLDVAGGDDVGCRQGFRNAGDIRRSERRSKSSLAKDARQQPAKSLRNGAALRGLMRPLMRAIFTPRLLAAATKLGQTSPSARTTSCGLNRSQRCLDGPGEIEGPKD